MKSVDMAVWAASRGWAVVKMIPGTKRPVEKWRDLGVRDPREVRRAWGSKSYGVGILTGPSGLVDDDLDIDDEGNPAGDWNMADLAAVAGKDIPRTFTVMSPSGGMHLVWKNMNGRGFRTSTGTHSKSGKRSGIIDGAPYIDVRGQGGLFVLWDPKRSYQILDDRDPVPIPGWLADLHPEPGHTPGSNVMISVPNTSAWIERYGKGEPCAEMERTLIKWLSSFDDGVPHDIMTGAVYALVGDAVAGHSGLKRALREIRKAHFKAMRGKSREHEKNEEWANAVNGAIAKKLGRVGGHVVDDDACNVEDLGESVNEEIQRQRNVKLLEGMRSGGWLQAQKFAPLRFAVTELVPEGLTLLAGAPKIGKSVILLQFGLGVASGGEVFGMECDKHKVLYLALEDSNRRMQTRCHELLDDGEIPDWFDYLLEVKPGKLIQTVRAYLDYYAKYRPMVLIDTLGKAMEPAERGETQYERDYRITSDLKLQADRFPGSAVVVSRHTNKGSKAEDWLDQVSGTNAISGSADTTLLLNRLRGMSEGLLHVTGRDLEDAEYSLILERPSGWSLDGDDLEEAAGNAVSLKQSAKLGDRSMSVIEYVSEHPEGVSITQIAKETDIPSNQVKYYVATAEKRQDIRKIQRGLYGPVGKTRVSSQKGSSSGKD